MREKSIMCKKSTIYRMREKSTMYRIREKSIMRKKSTIYRMREEGIMYYLPR